ncbi:MAG: IS5 family transposase [Lactobacillales bacterium]|nr:IS5 family transposase [Lactobacillales bacterium]
MYKINSITQISFEDFDQPMGLTMNPNNRWIIKSSLIPWKEFEHDYAKHFKEKGNVAKSLRTALGALIIQQTLGYSDEETVLQIQENPYLQYFIGLPGYQDAKPFDASSMVHFRKRLSEKTMQEINEKILKCNEPLPSTNSKDEEKDNDEEDRNSGTLILDATCAPQYIKYPTDIDLLNDAREHSEKIIDKICELNHFKKPRMYRRNARRDYLRVVRRKKKPQKWLYKQIRKQLNYVFRDIKYIDKFVKNATIELSERHKVWFETIKTIYDQQNYMYQNKVHSVENRIVSFSQPWIRPIVRGKVKSPTEFGAKLDMSIDSYGFARIEKISFDAYNESGLLIDAIKNFKNRTGYYPKRVLVDKIYRNRDNINYCKKLHIRISGPALGRPKKGLIVDKKLEYQDKSDRIEVERGFSIMKRKFSLKDIRTKLAETTLSVISLSAIAMNLSKLMKNFLCLFFIFVKNNELFTKKQ